MRCKMLSMPRLPSTRRSRTRPVRARPSTELDKNTFCGSSARCLPCLQLPTTTMLSVMHISYNVTWPNLWHGLTFAGRAPSTCACGVSSARCLSCLKLPTTTISLLHADYDACILHCNQAACCAYKWSDQIWRCKWPADEKRRCPENVFWMETRTTQVCIHIVLSACIRPVLVCLWPASLTAYRHTRSPHSLMR